MIHFARFALDFGVRAPIKDAGILVLSLCLSCWKCYKSRGMQYLGTRVNVDLSVLGELLGSMVLEGFSNLFQTLEGICYCLLVV